MTHSDKGIYQVKSEKHGSQYFLRVAVNEKPRLLLAALQDSGALGRREGIAWCRFAFKRRLFAFHDETFALRVSSECWKQHSRRRLGYLFRETGAPTQSHHGGTKARLDLRPRAIGVAIWSRLITGAETLLPLPAPI